MRRNWVAGAALALLAGCALRLGGPGPVEYRTVALSADPGAAPADVARWIRRADADLVLLSARADSTWFYEVARQAELSLSGPGNAGDVAFAFLAGKPVGDTTLALPLEGGGEIVVHDALYRIDESRYLDLLALRVGDPARTRAAAGALLGYVATDVMSNAAVVVAVDAADPVAGDSIAALLDPVFLDARACLGESDAGAVPASRPGMRLFYGPEARMRCDDARPIGGAGSPVLTRLIVGR